MRKVFLVVLVILVFYVIAKEVTISVPTSSDAHLSDPKESSGSASGSSATDTSDQEWQYGEEADKMTEKTTKYACVKSADELHFDFPSNDGSTGEICFLKKPGKNWAYFKIDKGQILCGFEGCTERIRVDGGPLIGISGEGSRDGDSTIVFLEPYSRVVSIAKKAKLLKFEALYFQYGKQVLEFRPTKPLAATW